MTASEGGRSFLSIEQENLLAAYLHQKNAYVSSRQSPFVSYCRDATYCYMQAQLHFVVTMLYVSLHVSAVLKLQFAMPGLAHLLLPVGALHLAPTGIGPAPFIGTAFVGTGAPGVRVIFVHGPPGPSSSVFVDPGPQLTVGFVVTVMQPGKSVSISNPRAAARQPLCNMLSILCIVSSCCCMEVSPFKTQPGLLSSWAFACGASNENTTSAGTGTPSVSPYNLRLASGVSISFSS